MATRAPTQQSWGLIFALLALLVIVVLLLPSFNVNVQTATQSSTQGECTFQGQPFDAQQEAYALAVKAQSYRTAHPSGSNYADASIILCKGKSTVRLRSPVYYGYNASDGDEYTTHAEQTVRKEWILLNLLGASKSKDYAQVTYIYVVLFSQVRVCEGCKGTMQEWQKEFRNAAGTENLALSIWQLTNGYTPSKLRSGRPVTNLTDVTEVDIAFSP